VSTALLDTSALISAVDAGVVRTLPFSQLTISSLSYAELRLGLVTAKGLDALNHRSRRLLDISQQFGHGIPFDDECAREYERLTQAAVGLGQHPRANTIDRMIAATALAHRLPIITRNAADLRGLDDLVEIIAV
jgi:toxin FitB